MKKYAILCAGLAVALASQTAKAQVVSTNNGLAIFYDTRGVNTDISSPAANSINRRGTSALTVTGKTGTILVHPAIGAGNNGGPGDGEVLYVSPRLPTNPLFQPTVTLGLHWTGTKNKAGVVTAVNQSLKSLHKYATVQQRSAPDEVVAALGLKTIISKNGTAGAGNRIENVTVTTVAGLWNGNNSVVTPGAPGDADTWTIDAKAVKVPVSDNGGTPVYNSIGGLIPQVLPHRLGSINITAGVWKKGVAFTQGTAAGFTASNGVYSVKDEVNNLLVTRVYSAGGPTPEEPDFGYLTNLTAGTAGTVSAVYTTGSSTSANLPEGNILGDGLTVGCTSTQPDATIVVQAKGDYDNTGTITSTDIGGMNAAIAANANATLRIRELWLGDFDNSNTVTSTDLGFFNQMISTTAGNDCAIPANCP